MKKLYFLCLFFLINLAHAQIIEFTDVNFKNALLNITTSSQKAKDLSGSWTAVDTNNNGEIEVSEAENLSYLNVSQIGITYSTSQFLYHNFYKLSLIFWFYNHSFFNLFI